MEVTTQVINHPTPTPKPHDDVVAEFGTQTRNAKNMIELHNEARQDAFVAMLPNEYECPNGENPPTPLPNMVGNILGGRTCY